MKITKCNSDLLKTALAPAGGPAAPAPAQPLGKRDNGQIANSLAKAAERMGMYTFVDEGETYGDETTYYVYCTGKRDEIEIKFVVNAHGNMDGKVNLKKGGDKMFQGGLTLMREIVAAAVRESGIAAVPVGRKVDPLLIMDPDIYRKQAAQHQAGQQPQVPGQQQAPSAEAI